MFKKLLFKKKFSDMGEGLRRTKTALSHFAPFLRPRRRVCFSRSSCCSWRRGRALPSLGRSP
jgi:hypothetical protein